MRRMRLHLRHLRKQVESKSLAAEDGAAAGGGGDGAGGDAFEMEFEQKAHREQLLKLKDRLVQEKQEKEGTHNDLKALRGQYDGLVAGKAKVQMQLIEVEEEKLRVSKPVAALGFTALGSTQTCSVALGFGRTTPIFSHNFRRFVLKSSPNLRGGIAGFCRSVYILPRLLFSIEQAAAGPPDLEQPNGGGL